MSAKKGINRREFLRLAGITAAAGAVATTGAACTKADGGEGSQPGGQIKFKKETDALIIGTGGAGLWAAYELIKAGIKPLIIEKQASWGGDTILACGVLPVHGTAVQKAQGIEDVSAEDSWNSFKDKLGNTYPVPELMHVMTINGTRAIDIWFNEFKVKWMQMDGKGYTKFFHIPDPGLGNDHKLLEPLAQFAKDNGAETMFDTKAISLILNGKNEVVGCRVQDQVSGTFTDIKAKKTLLATGDWVSNQEMVAKYLPKWVNCPCTTYTSMGNGVEMGLAAGAAVIRMDEPSNLMAHFAHTVVWGYYNSMIHVLPTGERFMNENQMHKTADIVHEKGFDYWWTIADQGLVNGVFATSWATRAKAGDTIKADTVEELAAKAQVPVETLKATIEKYNSDAKAGKDSLFQKTTAFTPLQPPYYACRSIVVRYKTNGGLSINEKAQVVDKSNNPIPNLYAAGSCQGATTPNVNDVSAIGMHAGQQMAAALGKSKS